MLTLIWTYCSQVFFDVGSLGKLTVTIERLDFGGEALPLTLHRCLDEVFIGFQIFCAVSPQCC